MYIDMVGGGYTLDGAYFHGRVLKDGDHFGVSRVYVGSLMGGYQYLIYGTLYDGSRVHGYCVNGDGDGISLH